MVSDASLALLAKSELGCLGILHSSQKAVSGYNRKKSSYAHLKQLGHILACSLKSDASHGSQGKGWDNENRNHIGFPRTAPAGSEG